MSDQQQEAQVISIDGVEHKVEDLPAQVVHFINRALELRNTAASLQAQASEALVLEKFYSSQISEAMKEDQGEEA